MSDPNFHDTPARHRPEPADPLRPEGDPEVRPDLGETERPIASFGPRKTDIPLQVAAEANPTMDTSFDEFAGDLARAEATFLAGRGDNYETYRTAFRFGWSIAHDGRFADQSWLLAEDTVRQEWLRDHDAWDASANAIRTGWEQARGAG